MELVPLPGTSAAGSAAAGKGRLSPQRLAFFEGGTSGDSSAAPQVMSERRPPGPSIARWAAVAAPTSASCWRTPTPTSHSYRGPLLLTKPQPSAAAGATSHRPVGWNRASAGVLTRVGRPQALQSNGAGASTAAPTAEVASEPAASSSAAHALEAGRKPRSPPLRVADVAPCEPALQASEAAADENDESDSDTEDPHSDLPLYTALTDDPPPQRVRGRRGHLYGFADGNSMLGIMPHEQPRRSAIFLVESTAFEVLILTTISLNCVTMALESPLDDRSSPRRLFLRELDHVFLYIFTVEQLAKMLAYGVHCAKGSFLFDRWALFEGAIVAVSWVPMLFPNSHSELADAVRALRALRLLLALQVLPGMKALINAALLSIPALASVAFLAACFYLLIAIASVNFFKGVLHYRCATAGIETLDGWGNDIRLASEMLETHGAHARALGAGAWSGHALAVASAVASSTHARVLKGGGLLGGGGHPEDAYDTGIFCYRDEAVCPADTRCVHMAQNPGEDTISFDSVPLAFFPLSTTIVLDSWNEPMYDLMAAYSPYVAFFFVPLAALGGFLILQLFLAVISDTFVDLEEARKERIARKHRERIEADKRAEQAAKAAADAESHIASAADAFMRTLMMYDIQRKLMAPLERSRLPSSNGTGDVETAEHSGAAAVDETSGSPEQASGQTTEQSSLSQFVTSGCFVNTSLLAVVVNVVVMCLPYHGQPLWYTELQDTMSALLTWVFIVEMGLKLAGLGCVAYWSDGWNVLDGSLVLLSISEMLLTILTHTAQVSWASTLRMLRMLRIVRAIRLLRSLKDLYRVVCAFAESIPQVANLILLMTVITFVFAVLGMSLFGGTGLREVSRDHFDNFPAAMITVFNIFIGAYFEPYLGCAQTVGHSVTAAYFVPALIIGYLTIINLFVAILLETFSNPQTSVDAGQAPPPVALDAPNGQKDRRPAPDQLSGVTCLCFDGRSRLRKAAAWFASHPYVEGLIITLIIASSIDLVLDSPRLDPSSELKWYLNMGNYYFTAIFTVECALHVFAYGLSTYLATAWNQLDFFIVLTSLLSLLAAVFPALGGLKSLRILRTLRPLRLLTRDPRMKLVIETLAKTMPAVINIGFIVLGLMVVFAVAGMKLFSGTFGHCTDPAITTRAACVDRLSSPPLSSPLPSIEPLLMRRLKGSSSPNSYGADDPVVWENPPSGSFDDFGEAMLSLFIATTGDNYPDILWTGIDSVGVDVAPVRADFAPTAIFFVLWTLVGMFMALNLFVGAIVDNFSKLRAANDGLHLLTQEQKMWVFMMREIKSMRPMKVAAPPATTGCCGRLGWLRLPVYNVIKSPDFDHLMMGLIVFNIATMAIDHHRIEEDALVNGIFQLLSAAFSYIYWIEFGVKIFGYGPIGYFSNAWCRFEFVLLGASLIERVGASAFSPMLFRVVRVIRVLRMVRLLRGSREVREVLFTLALSAPSLANIIVVLSIIVFIYAVLGIELFTYVQLGEAYNEYGNFRSFGNSCLLLFQVLTGDRWSAVMNDLRVSEKGGCDPHAEPSDCGSWLAMPFFVSFVLIGNFICLNLIVAVVLENFKTLSKQHDARQQDRMAIPL